MSKPTLEERQKAMLAKNKPPRPEKPVKFSQRAAKTTELPGEEDALLALWQRAQSGKQGSVQAYKTYLEHSVGKAAQKPPAPKSPLDSLSTQTINKIIELAEQIAKREIGENHAAALAQPTE